MDGMGDWIEGPPESFALGMEVQVRAGASRTFGRHDGDVDTYLIGDAELADYDPPKPQLRTGYLSDHLGDLADVVRWRQWHP